MDNLKIVITVTNGEKLARATVSVSDYLNSKNKNGKSVLDNEVDIILDAVDFTKSSDN